MFTTVWNTKICKKHGDIGYKEITLPATKMVYRCKNCGLKNRQKRVDPPNNDSLFREIKFDRSIQKLIGEPANEHILVNKFLNSLNSENMIHSLKNFMFSDDILENIAELTKCDKAVEKSHLKNLILWFFNLYTNGNYEQLAIKAVATNFVLQYSKILQVMY